MMLAMASLGNVVAMAQTVRNPKLATADLEAARSAARDGGGSSAELVYAVRIDAVTKGTFDSLIVIYSKGTGTEKQYYGLVTREGQKLALAGDQSGKAIPAGDRFIRVGLRHEVGRAPLLRLVSAVGDGAPQGEERQRNLDFRFNGKEFELVDQALVTPAK